MKKNLFLKSLLIAIGLLVTSINTIAWGQAFGAGEQQRTTIQCQKIMSGGAYNGTVYEPFSSTTPSEQSYSPAKAPGGPRREKINTDDDEGEEGEGWIEKPDYGGTDLSPIGEPWIMALFALAFAGVIAIRQYKRKTVKSMNMKNSTSKFIATLALLCTLGVGKMWGYTQTFDGNTYIYWYTSPSNFSTWGDDNIYIQLKQDQTWSWTGFKSPNDVNENWARYLVSAGTYCNVQLKTDYGDDFYTSSNGNISSDKTVIWNYGKDWVDYEWITTYFARSAYVYFDNSNGVLNQSVHQILLGRGGYPSAASKVYKLKQFSNTSLWYYDGSITYNNYQNFYFISNSSEWSGYESSSASSRVSSATRKTADCAKMMDHSSRQYNLFVPSSSSDGTSVTSYGYSGYSSLNSDQRVYTVARIPGGSYSSANAKTEVSMTSYALTGGTTCTQQSETLSTSESSKTISACRTATTTFTTASATGYTFDGWYTAANGGSQLQSSTTYTYYPTAATDVYARWTANTRTVTLDQESGVDGYGTPGTVTSKTATYNEDMPTIGGTMPIAATGYKFAGYYTGHNGTGTKYYNADGTSAHVWDIDENTTLYAYYQPAEMSLALASITIGTGEGDSATVSITPAVGSPAFNQVGTIMFCYDVKIKNGASMDPQPVGRQFTEGGVLKYRFASPRYSGNYTLNIKLRAGSDCSGAQIDSKDIDFIVSGDHTVTIRHKCGDVEIHEPTTVTIHPGEDADAAGFEDADVFGYHFSSWTIGGTSGVTQESGATSDREITISAIYDGTITANYNKRNLIFFKDNLGWGQVHVNLLKNMRWGYQGTGNDNSTCYSANESMTLVPGTTDIYYFEYSSISPYVSFTKQSYPYSNGFYEENDYALVVYPTRPNATVDAGPSYYDNQYYGFLASTPMFVPLASQTGQKYNNSGGKDHAEYFNKGYWTNYIGEETGYTLEVYNEDGSTLRQSKPFTSVDNLMEMTTSMDLEAGKTYKFQLKRGSIVCGNGGTMTALDCGKTLGWAFVPEGSKCGLTTTVAGIYDFKLSFSANGSECELRIAVTYPAAAGDYRLKYKDDDHDVWHPSDVVSNVHESNPIVSFFVRTGSKNQSLQVESCSVDEETGDVSWNTYGAAINPATAYSSVITKNGVYDFYMTINGSGALTIDSVKPYTGSYYIRTDVAGSTKWSDYRASDHMMTYTEYADKKNEFTHYYMHWCPKNTNVKFCIANDYSSSVSDTLAKADSEVVSNMDAGGNFSANDSANVRFMWNMHNNSLSRAYLAGAQTNGTCFLVLKGENSTKLTAPDGTALSSANDNNRGVGDNEIQFKDDQDWIYEAEVKAKPTGRIKLYARYRGNDHYFYGDDNASFTGDHGVELIGGSADGAAEVIRAIYDFKTNRLMAAWVPSGDIDVDKTIAADIMLVREGQNGGGQINLADNVTLTTSADKRVYGVMRFNRWDLNNLSRTSGHAVLDPGDQKTAYERFNYFISFPFDVKVGEIFGFGRIGRHYRIYFYDGIGRAQEGFFAERKTNWKMIDDTDSILHAYQGYFLQLNSVRMATDKTDVWPQAEQSEVELYFPAMKGITKITTANETIPALALDGPYKCTKDLSAAHGGNQEANRTNKDSYWRCIGTPSFANYDADFEEWTDFDYEVDDKTMPYLYEWETTTNKLVPVASTNFRFLSMHAYLIQNPNQIVWANVSKPTYSAIVARTRDTEEEQEWKLTLTSNNDELLDQAFVRMSDNEAVTANFDFGQDLVKEWNEGANIYTIAGSEQVAGNSMPFSNQTTIVPVGVKIAADGEYTFAMPEGTEGVGVVLIDNIAGARTNLALTDYTINLAAGTYDERFVLEISPVKPIMTDIETVDVQEVIKGARKVMVDGVLYIVKESVIYDARGNRVQ